MAPRPKTWPGIAASLLGLSFTGFNVYWAFGNAWLVDTVFPVSSLDAPEAILPSLVQWAAIVLKTGAALLGLVTLTVIARILPGWLLKTARILGWTAAVIIVFWGFTQTVWFALAKANVIQLPGWEWTDRSINGHVFLWDPWFLIWGLVLGYALLGSRHTKLNGTRAYPKVPGQARFEGR
ncbi:MAG: DUF3995 domain-containing protein [Bifidobacteriaceae bacterium]|nr:DUF3995 domain-containing protein [Bifidobacteriaceae bacterium]